MSGGARDDLTGARVRMKHDVWADDPSDEVAQKWAVRGDCGTVAGPYTAGWGYELRMDSGASFGADRDEIEVVAETPASPPDGLCTDTECPAARGVRSMSARPEVRKHESGLRVQAVTGPAVMMRVRNTVALPPCCPRSGNPREGSSLTLTYQPNGWCLEVYSLRKLIADEFVGGFKGKGRYAPDRNMEGMIATIAKMAADALQRPVSFRAALLLDAGEMELEGEAQP